MKNLLFLTVAFLIFVSIGCNTTGEPVEYARACDPANDKKVIETSGYLDDKGGVFCSNTSGRMECGFKLKNELKDEKGFTADIALDSGANAMDKLERGYKREDIKIRGNNGNPIDLSKKVKVTGTLTSVSDPNAQDGKVCYLKVTKIEQ